MKFLSSFLLLLVLTGCAGLPGLEEVQHSFVRAHPDTSVLGVTGELTNRWHADFHIYYLKPVDAKEHEDVWHYHHAAEAWVAGKQETIR